MALDLSKLGSLLVKPAEVVDLKKPKQVIPTVSTSLVRKPVYFDIETIPDLSRRHLFGLDEVVAAKEFTNPIDNPVSLAAKTVAQVTEILESYNPEESWLGQIESAERSREKGSRDGVLKVIKAIRDSRIEKDPEKTEVAKIKRMSLTPEFLKIAALAIGVGDSEPIGFVIDDHLEGGTISESDLLEWFWAAVEKSPSVIGFNVLHFDLPAIFVRSAMLGVQPSRVFDSKPWGTDVVDLMKKRWPSGNQFDLKKTADLYNIPVASDLDGSKVWETFQKNPYDLIPYNCSDVSLCQKLHKTWAGFFC